MLEDMLRGFRNRRDAGAQLAARLSCFASDPNVVVLGLPRGGVPVAFEVARALNAPLDVFLVRKLGLPGHPELAMGAIASGGVCVLNPDVFHRVPVSQSRIDSVRASEQVELERQERRYRGDAPPPNLKDRTVILVDDGLATGATMRAAVLAIRKSDPAWIVVAAPVGSAETCQRLRDDADQVICLSTPEAFYAVSAWYEDFSQTADEEVRSLLDTAAAELSQAR
jgi:predicted phosphoribosyltransferase